MKKQFSSCDHRQFHSEFDEWKKEMKNQLVKGSTSTGIYILSTNIPVPRILKTDSEGVLYIGQGDIFTDYGSRIGSLINAIHQTAKKPHNGGIRYQYIKEKYPISTLSLEVDLTDDCEEIEKRMLQEYTIKFGEVPPLNSL